MKTKAIIIISAITLLLTVGASAQTTWRLDGTVSGSTVNVVNGGILYDSGGPTGDYGSSQNYSLTICDANGGIIELLVSEFNTEGSFDYLTIYDGPNTSSATLVYQASGTSIQGERFESTGPCVTFVWRSDGSIQRSGFAIEITCRFPCQQILMGSFNTNPPFYQEGDYKYVDLCLGQELTLTGTGNYPQNNINYAQSDATSTFTWYLTRDNFVVGNPATFTATEPRGYDLTFKITDNNGCNSNVFQTDLRVRVSIPPTFAGTTITDTVCPHEPVSLVGMIQTYSWEMECLEPIQTEVCFDDHHYGIPQIFPFNVDCYAPGQTIQSMNDIQSICINMEHSYLGDLAIYLECPDGNRTQIIDRRNCTGTYFGMPDHADNCNPGEGWNYCWTMDAAETLIPLCSSYSTGSVPAGSYLPTGSFSSLVGCQINGTWSFVVIDDWGSDDGTLFSAELTFDEDIETETMWGYENVYVVGPDSPSATWTGEAIIDGIGFSGEAKP
ncbi:proprotein convertase P-domain-containing protein, partial [Bacteroidales bacterium OttesenSCG-928-I21]|nr:proprotein convertase P-domain-containing protein [Bacteroidales bacterium OttesenSCG-928-I21]